MSLPSPARRRIVTLLAVLPWPLILFQFLFTLPRYEKLFREYGLHMSSLTNLLFDIALWVRAYTFFAFALTLLLTGISVLVADFVQTCAISRWRRWLVLLVVFGVPCFLFVLSWLGVLGTHRKLVEGLNK
jgi:hypothetical protein